VSALVSLLLPTRGRPALTERFLRSAAEQAERREAVEVVVYADEDDPLSHVLDAAGLACTTIVGPRATMGTLNSACLARSRGEIVVLCNDDIVIRTPGWDRRLRETHAALRDGVYLAYPNDLFKGRKLCAFPMLSRAACDLLGEPFPRAYKGAFIDYHLLDIFKRLEKRGTPRLVYLEDVVFEHMHYRTGKSAYDDTYRTRGRFDDDDTFIALRGERSEGAARLARRIDPLSPGAAPRRTRAPVRPRPNLPMRLVDFARALLPDAELPLRWRLFLVAWFAGRTLGAKGYLPGLQRRRSG